MPALPIQRPSVPAGIAELTTRLRQREISRVRKTQSQISPEWGGGGGGGNLRGPTPIGLRSNSDRSGVDLADFGVWGYSFFETRYAIARVSAPSAASGLGQDRNGQCRHGLTDSKATPSQAQPASRNRTATLPGGPGGRGRVDRDRLRFGRAARRPGGTKAAGCRPPPACPPPIPPPHPHLPAAPS